MTEQSEFKQDIQDLVNLTTILEAAKDTLTERAKELVEKWENSSQYGELKIAQYKKMAMIIYKDSLEEERQKMEDLFSVLETISK